MKQTLVCHCESTPIVIENDKRLVLGDTLHLIHSVPKSFRDYWSLNWVMVKYGLLGTVNIIGPQISIQFKASVMWVHNSTISLNFSLRKLIVILLFMLKPFYTQKSVLFEESNF